LRPTDYESAALTAELLAHAKTGRSSLESGADGRTRTCDLRLRRPTLYPAELHPHPARQDGLGDLNSSHDCGSCMSELNHPDSSPKNNEAFSFESFWWRPQAPRSTYLLSRIRYVPNSTLLSWGEERDSNPRQLGPHPSALPTELSPP
jgi:hypothetical protein